MTDSKTELYLHQRSMAYKPSGADQLAVELCPFCGNSSSKFYISKTTGLWDCKVCGEAGNLSKLRAHFGDSIPGVQSTQEAFAGSAPTLRDPQQLHEALMRDEEALAYLVEARGFTVAIVERYKLGLEEYNGTRWLSIPYFNADGTHTYTKCRTLPPAPKGFRGSSGRENPLFNGAVLDEPGLKALLMVEGEADCLSCLSNGVTNVVGLPGANMKKASWITKIDQLPLERIYLLYDNDKVGQRAAREMANRIGIEKCYNILLPDFTTAEGKPGKDINEWFMAGHTAEDFAALLSTAKKFDVNGVTGLQDCLEQIEGQLSGENGGKPALDTPWPSLNARLGGLEYGDLVGVIAEGKVGKVAPLSAKILTPQGWVTNGSLHIGQELASVDGEKSFVTGLFPQAEKKQMYRVTFSDGRSTLCGAEHLWKVGGVSNFTRDEWRVVNTEELTRLVKGTDVWFVPLFNGDFGVGSALPLDPWFLGALLGDGGFTARSPTFTKDDAGVIDAVREHCKNHGTALVTRGVNDYRIVGTVRGFNPVRMALRQLSLDTHLSPDKFIPQVYLDSPREERMELLRGLMDTDGSCEGNHRIPVFNTSSERLANDVAYLVRSLGGAAPITSRIPDYTYKGEKLKGLLAYRVFVKLREPVFKHSRKAKKECVRSRQFRLSVVSVEPEGVPVEAQCIAVSHPSQLYITDDFVVTHNSTMALNWLDYYAMQGVSALFYCLEMPTVRVARKWVSYVTQTDDSPNTSQMTVETIKDAKQIVLSRQADLLLGYTRMVKADDVFETIRQTVRRYGVKVVAFDNLQLLVRSIEHSSQETSVLTKRFKELAMELGILIILIVQPNRVREGEIVGARNSMGSSAIEKDVDAMIALHRNRVGNIKQGDFMGFMETDENFSPEMLVRVDLSRYSAGGVCTLFMDGGKSTVREMVKDEMRVETSGKLQVVVQGAPEAA